MKGVSSSLVLRLARRQLAAFTPPSRPPALERLSLDPTYPMRAVGLTPDPWQDRLIRSKRKQIAALCTRRAGKSHAAACRALTPSLTRPNYRTLVFSPTEDQSQEFLHYVRAMNEAVGCPVPLIRESLSELAWANGSRIEAKAGSARSSRGFTPDLVVVDEGAQVSDELYLSIRPMLALGKADLVAISTPFGKLGWFFDLWNDAGQLKRWETYRVTAYECPRIDRAFLAQERECLPPRWFNQEYLCEFNDAVDAVFGRDVIESAARDDEAYLPLDLGV